MVFILLLSYVAARLSWMALAAVILIWMCLCKKRQRLKMSSRQAALPLLLILALAHQDRNAHRLLQGPFQQDSTLRVWVCERPTSFGQRSQAIVQVLNREIRSGLQPGMRLLLRSKTLLPNYGTELKVSGRLEAARQPKNFGAFDERAYLTGRNTVASLRATAWEAQREVHGNTLRRELIEPFRQRALQHLETHLTPRTSGLLAALVVGVRDGLDRDIVAEWRSLGLSHILAISGLHVGLFAAGIWALLGEPRKLHQWGLYVVSLLLFGLSTGLSPSVLRACGMAIYLATSTYLLRRRNSWQTFAFVVLLLLLCKPSLFYSVGFQLSVSATGGILCLSPLLSTPPQGSSWPVRTMRFVISAVVLSLAAQCATLPILVQSFGVVPYLAPVFNVVVVPLVHGALVLTLVATPLLFFLEAVGRPLLLTAALLLHVALKVTQTFATHTQALLYFSTSTFQTWVLMALCALALIAVRGCFHNRTFRWRLFVGVALLLLLAQVAYLQRPKNCAWCLEALDVGQGDALLLSLDQDHWLFDSGHSRPMDYGARVVVPRLKRLGIRRLRGFVLSHPHLDHCGGALSILGDIQVDTLYVAKASREEKLYRKILSSTDTPIRLVERGDSIQLSTRYAGEVLWPPATDELQSGANGQSIVLLARGAPFPDLLFMGDLEEDGEAKLLVENPPVFSSPSRTLVLKVGHHGSSTSSTPEFLDAIDPEVALISVGRRNRYGHPAEETLRLLTERDCHFYRTDLQGSIRLRLRRGNLWLERPGRTSRLEFMNFSN